MFSIQNRTGSSLFLAIIVVGLILVPNSMNQPVNAQVADAGLTVTPHTVTVGTCTRSGTYTQKFVHNPSARSSYTTHWSPGLPELALGYQITVDGYGYVQASINYNVGSDTGSYTWPALKVGSWGHKGALDLWAAYATRVTAYTGSASLSFARIDNHAYGTYNWSSSGTVTLQAKYCKRTGPYWCEWEDLGSPGSESFSGSGSWTLTKTFVCPNCSQDVPYTNYHKVTCNMTRYSRGTYSGCGAKYWSCVLAMSGNIGPSLAMIPNTVPAPAITALSTAARFRQAIPVPRPQTPTTAPAPPKATLSAAVVAPLATVAAPAVPTPA